MEEGRRAIPPRVGGFPGCPGSVDVVTEDERERRKDRSAEGIEEREECGGAA